MIANWIGRVLGSSDTPAPARSAEPLVWTSATAGDSSSLASVVDSPDLLHMELERARRYERDLSIVVLSIEPLPSGAENGDGSHDPKSPASAGPPQVVSLLAAAGLREMLRQSDVLCYQATEDRFVLALAESNAEQARGALSRIRALFRERLVLGIRTGLALFPDDALTLAELVAKAGRTVPGVAGRHGAGRPPRGAPASREPESHSSNGKRTKAVKRTRQLRRATPSEVNDDA